MPGPLERLLFFVLLLTLAWGVAMNVQAHGIAPAEEVPAGCYFSGQPIVDVELAQSSECFVAVTTVRGDDETADELATRIARNLKLFRANTRMDFFFIALYWLVFVLFGWATDNGRVKWLLLAFVTLSSAFDVAENVRILAGLSSVTHQTAVDHLPRTYSQIKWICFALTLFTCRAFSHGRGPGRLRRLTATALVLSGALTLTGLALPKILLLAGLGFVVSFLLVLARVWPYPAATVLLWIEYAYLLRFQITAAGDSGAACCLSPIPLFRAYLWGRLTV
jgi:hypothetical protein